MIPDLWFCVSVNCLRKSPLTGSLFVWSRAATNS